MIYLGASVALGNSTSVPAAKTETFDKPVNKTVVNLGRSQTLGPRDSRRVQLYCYYFQDFMVKELKDPGMKGTRWVTVTTMMNEDEPACRVAHDAGERYVAKLWWSFKGVKGSLLFLEAADGEDGGMAFRVLELKSGKKIFEDTARAGRVWFARVDETVSLRYLRMVEAGCSIPKDGISCWNKSVKRYGLGNRAVPKCSGYREEGEKEWSSGDAGLPPEEIGTSSVIFYPFAVDIFSQPSIRVVRGEVKCSPVI